MRRKRSFKRLLSLVLTLSMLFPMSGMSAYAVENEENAVTFTEADNSSVSAELPGRVPAEEIAEPVAYADGDQVRVSIILESDSAIEKGFSMEDIGRNRAAARYRENLRSEQDSVVSRIEAATQENLDVVWNLTLAANIVSANVEYGQIEAIQAVPGVKSVVIENRYEPAVISKGGAEPNMSTSGIQIGSVNAWAEGYTGAGSRIAVIDTGIDTDHQSFDGAAFDYSLEQLYGSDFKDQIDLMDAGDVAAVADQLNAKIDPAKTFISDKIPYGYNYVDEDYDVTHDNDSQGEHGSHVEGIAAANAYIPDGDGFVSALDSVYVQGVAPDAQILTMKVFGKGGGAYDSDYMVAIEDAIVLGADSINLSLGSSNPGVSREADYAYQDILDSLTEKGAVVTISAGNSGTWGDGTLPMAGYLYSDDVSYDSVGSPGSYTNSLAVASVDNAGMTGYYFTVDGNNIFYTETTGYKNQPMASIPGEQEYIFIDGIGSADEWAAVGDALQGKVAFCARGSISFYEKGDNAAAAGAIATVIYNNQPGVINMDLSDYKHTQPCVSITQDDGALIREAATPVTDDENNVLYYTGTLYISESLGSGAVNTDNYTMSSFSSWGVPGSLELKPEITAPGGNIYSVNGAVAGGTSYENMSGTSMAAPQVAGMAALVAQYIRENGLSEKTGKSARQLAQSLLMSTAVPIIEADSGNYYSILNQGAGLANVGDAVAAESYIWMDENATASYADGKVKAELGDDPERTGEYSFSFSINNFSDEDKNFDLSANLFTQDIFDAASLGEQFAGIGLLDTWTIPLSAAVTWTADGKPVDSGKAAELKNYDFDGDGDIDVQDGQALLEYLIGGEDIYHKDNADIDADGDIDTYDAYLFFTLLNEGAVTVPANSSVKISVSIKLGENIADFDDKGAYVEGYVFVDELTSADGALGESHSIPVLGYYGSWTEPSMFDVGSRVEYEYGMENRLPYMYAAVEEKAFDYNTLTVQYAGDSNNYYFGGNPLLTDETYMPERNAINGENGDKFSKLSFSAIRNAAATHFSITDGDGNIYKEAFPGSVDGAFYYTNGASWQQTAYTLNVNTAPTGLEEGTPLNISLTLAPEYYVDENGEVDWDALGEGATFSVPAIIDNTAPVITDVSLDLLNNTLNVTASDNQYVAAVALFNNAGTTAYSVTGSKSDIAAGESAEYALDLEGVNGKSFLLQVYDYAMNTATYKVNAQIGEEQPLPGRVAFDLDENIWITFSKESTHNDLTAYAPSDVTFFAATIVDHIVFASTDNGDLYVMPESDLTDKTLVGNMGVVLTDMAYNKADGNIYGVSGGILYTVNKLTGEAVSVAEIGVLTNTLACDDKGTFFCNKYGSGEIYSFTLDTIAAPQLVVSTANRDSAYVQTMEVDPNTGLLCWNSYYLFSFYGYTFGYSYYYEIDPVAKTYTRYNDLYDEISSLIIPVKSTGGDWMEPTDEISGIQLSEDTLTLLRGASAQLTASVQPWTLSDRSVTWSTSDAAVATVNERGVVTAVAPGTAVITAAAKLDPSYTASCTVTVSALDVTLKGVLQDENGESQMFSWNMETDAAWTAGNAISTSVNSATLDPVNNALYVMDAVSNTWSMHKIDPATGETLQSGGNNAGVPLWDMEYSSRFATAENPLVASIYYYYFLAPKDPMNLNTSAFNLQSRLESAEASYLVAVTSLGAEDIDYNGEIYETEHFVLLDNAGNVWNWWVYQTEDSYSAILSRYASNLMEEFPGDSSGENMYCSMVAAEDGVLYLSAFNGETNNIYRLVLNDDEYTCEATLIGDVGYDVWPAALYAAELNGEASGKDAVRVVTGAEQMQAEPVTAVELFNARDAFKRSGSGLNSAATGIVDNTLKGTDEYTLQSNVQAILDARQELLDSLAKPVVVSGGDAVVSGGDAVVSGGDVTEPTAPVPGGLNTVSTMGQVAPAAVSRPEKDEASITVIVTAKNADGKDVDSTNGRAVVNYDREALELKSVRVYGDYNAENETEGSVIFDYVSLKGITAGNAVAELVFGIKDAAGLDSDETPVTILHQEVGNTPSGYTEEVALELHEQTETRGAKEATCTEDGYTGDEVCVVCGKVVKKGEVIPALGHKTEISGAKEATCTEDGYTGDKVCTVCGEVVEKGQSIPAFGHSIEIRGAKEATATEDGYTGDEYCTVCGQLIRQGSVIPATGAGSEPSTDDGNKPSTDDGNNQGGSTDTGNSDASQSDAAQADASQPAAPATGDSSNVLLWIVLAAALVAGVAVLVVNRKKWFRS